MTFQVPERATYSLAEEGGRLTAWVNRTPSGEEGAPKENEPFLLLFTEPWTALRFRKHKLPKHALCYADNDRAWEFYRDYGLEVMKADRAIVNMCWQPHPEAYFQIIPLKDISLDFLTKQPSAFEAPCSLCYNKSEVDDEQENVTVLTTIFD